MLLQLLFFRRVSFLLVCFLQVHGNVLQTSRHAHSVLIRSKRANMFLVEEILEGNLERECHEEVCNYEEAREVFEDTQQTNDFWSKYYAGHQCQSSPCLNGGTCSDLDFSFSCSCIYPHYGNTCQLTHGRGAKAQEGGAKAQEGGAQTQGGGANAHQGRANAHAQQTHPVGQCPSSGPSVCPQLCSVYGSSFSCSCMKGFKLQTDERTCLPEVAFPCGRVPDPASTCLHGNCPWQVVLLNQKGEELCGGVVLNHQSVLTSARCLVSRLTPLLQPSDVFVRFGKQQGVVPVWAVYVHQRFHFHRHDYDLALLLMPRPLNFSSALIHLCLPTKDFSENVLMHFGRSGVTQGSRSLVYMTLEECRQDLNLTHPLSNKMFCMRNHNQDRDATQMTVQRDLGPSKDRKPVQTDPAGAHADPSTRPSSSPQSHPQRSEVSGGDCGTPLPGTPVATEEQGIMYLTGILTSTTGVCGEHHGMVFTKLSRHLNWIQPKLQENQDHITPQVRDYPEVHMTPRVRSYPEDHMTTRIRDYPENH